MAAPAIVPISHSSIQAFRSPSGAGASRVIVQHEFDEDDEADSSSSSSAMSLFQKLMKSFAKKSSSFSNGESFTRSSLSLSNESRSSTFNSSRRHQRAGSSGSESLFASIYSGSTASASVFNVPLRQCSTTKAQLQQADSEEQFQCFADSEKLNEAENIEKKGHREVIVDADSKEEESQELHRVSVFTYDGKRSELISTMLGSSHQCDIHVRQESVVLKRSMSFSAINFGDIANSIILEDSDDEDEEEYMYISSNMSFFPEVRRAATSSGMSRKSSGLWAVQEEEDSGSEDEVI